MELRLDLTELEKYLNELSEKMERMETCLVTVTGNQRYFSRQEAADYLRISVATLDRIAAAGEIAPAKLGDGPKSTVIYDREDLDEYMRSRKGFTAREADNIIKMAR